MSEEASVTYLDVAGREIKPGDFVVYASMWGRSSTLKFGRVTRLAERELAYVGKDPRARTGTLRLVTVDRDWGGKWELQKNGKEVTLDRLEQVMVVELAQLSVEVRKLLLTKEDYVPWMG